MMPYNYTADQAGITGAVLIVSGLLATAILCPIVDRTHAYLLSMRVQVPLIGIGYIALIFAIISGGSLVWPILVVACLGAASFSLLPLVLEWVVEMTYPAPPEITSAILWGSGQLMGGVFILVMDAMKDEQDGGKMRRYVETCFVEIGRALTKMCVYSSLIFEAVVAVAVAPLVFLLVNVKKGAGRLAADKAASDVSSVGSSAALI